jgi:hypothetical protein
MAGNGQEPLSSLRVLYMLVNTLTQCEVGGILYREVLVHPSVPIIAADAEQLRL